MSQSKQRTAAVEAPQESSPPDVQIVKPSKDSDGNHWTVEKEGEGVRVHLLTKDGRSLNAFAADEAAGRLHFREFLKSE